MSARQNTTRQHTICVFTGTRAEYGLLAPLMRRIQGDGELTLQVLVSGAHLSAQHGNTARFIEQDGFTIDAAVPLDLDDDSPLGMTRATGQAVADLGAALNDLMPDIVVVLGDRYEAFACASAATLLNIPIAHIHGGEITQGAIDDALRHAITKLAHLHFPAAEPYRKRIIQMGEAPETVFNTGAPGLEVIQDIERLDRSALEDDLGFALTSPFAIVTYHPETRDPDGTARGVAALLDALGDMDDLTCLFTHANADAHGQIINDAVAAFADRHAGRAKAVPSLGQARYLSALALADVAIGNSSSAIIEAPALGIPVVNIGARQDGRLFAPAVISCTADADAIAQAVRHALSPQSRAQAARCETPYGGGATSAKILAALKNALTIGLPQKRFFDLPQPDGATPERLPERMKGSAS